MHPLYVIVLAACCGCGVLASATCQLADEQNIALLRDCRRDLAKKPLNPKLVTHCYVERRGWYNSETGRWRKQRIVDECGADAYNYCRFQFDRHGLLAIQETVRCLDKAGENIERSQNSLLGCAVHLNTTMSQLYAYARFPVDEVIPCLFQCFAERMQLYTQDGEWIFANWLEAFGPVGGSESADRNQCRASAQQRHEQTKCSWMYAEYLCLERLYYNTSGSEQFTSAIKRFN